MPTDLPNDDTAPDDRYAYKASLIGSAHQFELTSRGLSWKVGGRSGVWAYTEISAISLSYRPMTMQSRRFRADISRAGGGRIMVLSTTWQTVSLMAPQDHGYRVFITGSNMIQSNDGGKTWAGLNNGGGGGRGGYPFISTFGDFRSFWIDPEDSDHMVATSDGGVSVSYDGGRTSDHFANLKLGEFYAIGVDMDQPYHVYGGLQDHESWKGPSNGWSGRINIDDWVSVGIGDGMYNEPDPTGPAPRSQQAAALDLPFTHCCGATIRVEGRSRPVLR